MSGIDAAFGQNLRTRRLVYGISQREMGTLLRRAGLLIDASAVSRIESGERSVRLSEAVLIADALGCGLVDLLPDAGEDPHISRAQAAVDVAIAELMKIREAL